MTRVPPYPQSVAMLTLLAAAVACHDSGAPQNFTLNPLPTNARAITVTLDRCDCTNCRVAVKDPVTGGGILSRTNPVVGVEISADNCYNDTMVTVIVECGICPGPGNCTAEVTLKATGVKLAPSPTTPSATCTTAPFPGQDCQDQQTYAIPANAMIVGC